MRELCPGQTQSFRLDLGLAADKLFVRRSLCFLWAWPAADKLFIWRDVKMATEVSGLGRPLINCSHGAMSKIATQAQTQKCEDLVSWLLS